MAYSESTVDTRSGSGDLYLLGRYVNDYTTSLIWALRATGDLSFLDRAAELWENARLDLSDAWCNGTTDGYLNWLWLYDPTASAFYCNDLHEMDDSMTHGVVAMLAHALDQNRQFGNGYGAKADFWVDYLENHFLQKWYDRDGSALISWQSGGLYKRLTHPRMNQLRIAYYLHKITGNTFYVDRAQEMVQELVVGLEVNPTVPTAYQWKHQISGNDEGYQRINYAHYYMNGILEMYFEQFDVYGDESEMQKYMSTFRDVVLTKFGSPWNNMSYLVDGSGSTSMNLYGLTSFARWDTTGTLLQIANDVYSTSSNVALSAGVLLGLTDREVGSENVAPYTAYYDAESGTIQSSFQVALDPLASNGAYVTTPPGTPTLTTGTAEIAIPINVPSSGTYYLWARILGPASDQDASFVGVDGSLDRVFPSTLGVWEWVRVEVTHGSGDYAHLLSAGPHELAVGHGEAEAQVDVLLVTDDSQLVPTSGIVKLFFTQFGNGAGMTSTIVLSNPSTTMTVSGQINFFDEDGLPFSVGLATTERDGTALLAKAISPLQVTSNVQFTIPPLSAVTISTDGQGEKPSVGSAIVTSNGSLGGVIRFSIPGAGIVGVGASQPVRGFIVPARRKTDGINTGLAIQNTEGFPVTLDLTLRDPEGEEVPNGTATIEDLVATGHLAKFIDELFPSADTGDFQGTLAVDVTGGKVAAAALELGPEAGQFTTLPVTSTATAMPGMQTTNFAQFGNGNGLVSDIVVVNPSSSETATGTAEFFDGSGAPLPVGIVGREETASTADFSIPASGAATISTDGQGETANVGSAVVTSESSVGGIIRFSIPGIGFAGVGASQPVSGFIVPARRMPEGIRTGVAVHNVEDVAVTLNLTLRDMEGEEVPNGEAAIEDLAATGHIAKFIDELFPTADIGDFEGTLVVEVTGGNVAATALELGSQPGQFTTLPVTPLQ